MPFRNPVSLLWYGNMKTRNGKLQKSLVYIKVEQVRSNARASSLTPLEASTHDALYSLYQSEIDQYIRGAY